MHGPKNVNNVAAQVSLINDALDMVIATAQYYI